jgi:hypothetical protein
VVGRPRLLLRRESARPRPRRDRFGISGIEGPGTLRLESSASLTHTIQLANLDGERFLNGGAMGFDVTVELLAVSSEPAHVEARFSGTLGSSAGRALRIEDGFVRCTE